MQSLNLCITVILFLFSTLFHSHSDKVAKHKIYCPEDMYGQEYLKFYNMTAFLTTWTTTSPNESITIPTTGGGYLYDVAWGDGTTSVNRTGNATHVYSTPGDYQISITGSFPRIFFNDSGDKLKIKSIDQWGVQPWISMESAFWGCQYLEEQASDSPNLSNATSLSKMFRDCYDLNQDISNWDVSNITDMSEMFHWASTFDQNINSWDVSSVTNMSKMFLTAFDFNQSLNNWDVSNVTNMSQMFDGDVSGISFNQDISNWDVSSVTDMSYMFSFTSDFNQDISSWNVSSVSDMSGMFQYAESFNQNINLWDVSNVIDMSRMFYAAIAFNKNIGSWDVSNVTDMSQMFSAAILFNQDISNWDVSNVTDMSYMFNGFLYPNTTSNFNQNIGSWNVSSVNDMSYMFRNATSFNQNLNDWDVSGVANMLSMFESSSFDNELSNWDISHSPDMRFMFRQSMLSTENYDMTLIGWAQLNTMAVNFDGGNSQYCAGADARDMLINTYGWNITDGGEAVSFSIDNTFTNSNGNNLWEDAGNWSLMSRPTAIHHVIIPSGMTCIVEDWFLPTTFEDGLCYTIDVQDGAVFEVIDGATFRTAFPCNY